MNIHPYEVYTYSKYSTVDTYELGAPDCAWVLGRQEGDYWRLLATKSMSPERLSIADGGPAKLAKRLADARQALGRRSAGAWQALGRSRCSTDDRPHSAHVCPDRQARVVLRK